MTASLLDHLQAQGYEPQEAHVNYYGRQDWYDLVISGIGTVRAVIYHDDGPRADVHTFDKYMAQTWSAQFSPGTPHAAIISTLEAAEWEMAARRGGPVTPAQARNV